jgi:hypothetical protein
VTDEQADAIWQLAKPLKRTVGSSFDDGGIGDLDQRIAVLWNIPEADRPVFADWYAKHYSGVVVEFREYPEPQPVHEVAVIVDDLPKHETKTYRSRALTDITTLTMHHTVSPPDRSIASIAAYHVDSRGWPGIAYHYVINDKGDIYQTNWLETISYHAGVAGYDNNEVSVGVSLQGDFTDEPPPQAQLDAARWLVQDLRGQLGDLEVVPHRLMPGASTACPGATWDEWIDLLS